VRGALDDPLIGSIRTFHQRLWHSGMSVRVTNRFKLSYQRLQQRRHDIELSLRAEADYGRAARDLKVAVVEALANAREPGERRSWLLITSPANFIRNMQGSIWGDEKRSRIAQVRPGDAVFFYITIPLMQLGAMGLVTKGLFERRADSNWGRRLQASMKPLTPRDAELLRSALVQADRGASVA